MNAEILIDCVASAYPGEKRLINKSVPVGKYEVSLQASEGHCCAPRANFADMKKYTSYEVAIILNGQVLTPASAPDLFNHSWASDHNIYGHILWVNRKQLDQMINYLLNRS